VVNFVLDFSIEVISGYDHSVSQTVAWNLLKNAAGGKKTTKNN